MFRNMKYIWVMLALTVIIPMVAFLWGDNLIMFVAGQSIKKGDVSQTFEYYQRLETFFPASSRIPEARFYKAGIIIEKNPMYGREIYRFTGYNGSVITQNHIPPYNDNDLLEAFNILVELDQIKLGKNNEWIKNYLPWLISKTYYQLGKADEALEILSTIDYNKPETSWPLTTWSKIQMSRGNYAETIKAIDGYLNKFTNIKEGMTAELLEIKGDASLALGRLDDAESSYIKAKEYARGQFSWLCRQRFIMCIRPELARENFEKALDTKIDNVDLIREPLTVKNDEGIYGNFSIGGMPVIGESIYMASVGEDILFSGSAPATDVTYTDVNGNFYFPEVPENPFFGIGVPEEQAGPLTLSIKVDSSHRQPVFKLNLVPTLKLKTEIQGEELILNFEPVSGAVRYELYIVPPEKESSETKEIALGTILTDKSDSRVIWKRHFDEIITLKPFPLLYDEIKPYHILGPVYPDQKSFINIKAFDENYNLLSDSLGFLIIGVNDDNTPGISIKRANSGDTYVAKGLYVHGAEEYENILQKSPTDAETLDKLARLYLWAPGVKDTMKAQEVITKIMVDSKKFRLQAEIDYRKNEFEQVRRVLEEALGNDNLDPAGYHILAQIYLQNHEYKKSIKYFNHAFNLSGKKFIDYSPITAYCLVSDFDGAITAAKEIIYDGQRFYNLLDMIRTKNYPPEVMKDFKNMLLPLTQNPDKTSETEFDEVYKVFNISHPEHKELSEIAFKLAFRRFQH